MCCKHNTSLSNAPIHSGFYCRLVLQTYQKSANLTSGGKCLHFYASCCNWRSFTKIQYVCDNHSACGMFLSFQSFRSFRQIRLSIRSSFPTVPVIPAFRSSLSFQSFQVDPNITYIIGAANILLLILCIFLS